MKKLNITQDLAQAIVNYLATRPYAEVYRMVQGLQSLEVHPEPEKEEDSKPKSKSVK